MSKLTATAAVKTAIDQGKTAPVDFTALLSQIQTSPDGEAAAKQLLVSLADPKLRSGDNQPMWDSLVQWMSTRQAGWLSQPTQWYPIDDNTIPKVNTIAELQQLIIDTAAKGATLRSCGAQHSAPEKIWDASDKRSMKFKLQGDFVYAREVTANRRETQTSFDVGAGTHLGIDPHDPASNESNSLTRTLWRNGWSLDITGGMSHQTVGGFMATSTAGGSLQYSVHDQVEEIDFVDGLGVLHTTKRGEDLFNAAGVSMGLFGILTRIRFSVKKSYLVIGTEQTVLDTDPACVMKTGSGFVQAAKDHPYLHNVWFPNENCHTVLQWMGTRDTVPNHTYVAYKHVLEAPIMQALAVLAIEVGNLFPSLAGYALYLANSPNQPQKFNDYWWRCLPNDDLTSIDTWIRVQFTELWIDVADADLVFAELQKMWKANPASCGNFGCEFYTAKGSDFWMSMSHDRPNGVIRVDPYWFEWNVKGTLEDFFKWYWDLLLKVPSCRLHWGKHWPAAGNTYTMSNGTTFAIGKPAAPGVVSYGRTKFAKYDQWMALRAQMDPKQIFVTDYWRQILEIPYLPEP